MPEGYEHHGTFVVHKGDDDELTRIPKPPSKPLPADFEGVRVRRPNDSRLYPADREKAYLDREVDLLASQYWFDGMSEREARDRAEARVEHLRERGEQ
jgi:hypothetical protein